MKLYEIAKKLYMMIPCSMRKSKLLVTLTNSLLPHDTIYSETYYEYVDEAATRSAGKISDSIINEFSPKSIIDVGCGTCALLEKFQNQECRTFGLEYSLAGLKVCRKRGIEVEKFDITHDTNKLSYKYDAAISMEVAEHLPEKCADRFVELSSDLSSIIIFTAAHPGQGGDTHLNKQPANYWIEKFVNKGFMLNKQLTEKWKNEWSASGEVESWYHQNLMIFSKTD